MIVHALLGKDNLLEHAKLFAAVLARLIFQVRVYIFIHQVHPLLDVVECNVHAHTALAGVAREVEDTVPQVTFSAPRLPLIATIAAPAVLTRAHDQAICIVFYSIDNTTGFFA